MPRVSHAAGLLLILVRTNSFSPSSSGEWFFGCRHGHEKTLQNELILGDDRVRASHLETLAPGLVRWRAPALESVTGDAACEVLRRYDLTWATQVLPACRRARADSIGALASGCIAAAGLAVVEEGDDDDAGSARARLLAAPRGSLRVHALVPDTFKGANRPALQARCEAIAEKVTKQLRAQYRAARPARSATDATGDDDDATAPRWLLQLLLVGRAEVAVSLARCAPDLGVGSWPNWRAPAGLCAADVDGYMPSSAYRKLAEALDLMGLGADGGAGASAPLVADGGAPFYCVDLGASPGGWTALLRRRGCRVVAVDRSPLDGALFVGGAPANAADFARRGGACGFERTPADGAASMVAFVAGDAFAWTPPDGPADLMVCDVASYPKRVAELLERWCGARWAARVIVTCKFQGDEPDWGALEDARAVARKHGYEHRSKHFFNNKNECTLMLRLADESGGG